MCQSPRRHRSQGSLADAAIDYAQHIPVRIIAKMLGLDEKDGDRFRVFIHRILAAPGSENDQLDPEETLEFYLNKAIQEHRDDPRDDLMGYLINLRVDGEPLSDEHIRGTCALLLIAGIDTTWSAIGASLWHLAQHEVDRRRLVDNPELIPTAIEEFLRAYAPVTMARWVKEDVELGGCPMKRGDKVLLPFPAGNRDPEAFERADEVLIDRAQNRHAAFGLGIHRCVGSNLARMELTVAVEEWLKAIPNYELTDPEGVIWSTGQVRGPRELPITILDH
ncbi:MAG: cytochrome P450 [Acidimicrobiales bacterium]